MYAPATSPVCDARSTASSSRRKSRARSSSSSVAPAARACPVTASAAYTATGGASYGYITGRVASSYTSAARTDRSGRQPQRRAAAPSGADNLAGPQAILYRRAIAEFDQVRQALASLQPEDSEDSQEFESIRSLVDDGLVDLVTAFGSELRPPVARVDGTFDDLLGGDGGGGWLRWTSRRALGGYPISGGGTMSRVTAPPFLTLAEEQEQTRFLELATYVTGLRSDWEPSAQQSRRPTLNVRSTVLGRRIGFVADAVRELDLALATAPGDPARAPVRADRP